MIVQPSGAVVIGASGGIGAAVLDALRAGGRFAWVEGLSRSGPEETRIDVADEASIAAAAERLAGRGELGLVFVATGLLHGAHAQPEKSWRGLSADALLASYHVNAVGPALVAKHFLPLLPRRGRAVFAALSARVGSIGDNRLGGWYAYRASKAALNMLIRNLAVELARTRPDAVCVSLHPGTVDTSLSRPFQAGVAEGRLFTPAFAAARLLDVIDGLTPAESGNLFAWDGRAIPF